MHSQRAVACARAPLHALPWSIDPPCPASPLPPPPAGDSLPDLIESDSETYIYGGPGMGMGVDVDTGAITLPAMVQRLAGSWGVSTGLGPPGSLFSQRDPLGPSAGQR